MNNIKEFEIKKEKFYSRARCKKEKIYKITYKITKTIFFSIFILFLLVSAYCAFIFGRVDEIFPTTIIGNCVIYSLIILGYFDMFTGGIKFFGRMSGKIASYISEKGYKKEIKDVEEFLNM